MLHDVQTCQLFLAGNAQTDGFLNYGKYNGHRHCYPSDNGNCAQQLNPEQGNTAAQEKAEAVCTAAVGK